MAGTLYANPLFASGMASVLDSFLGGNPREAAAAELYAAQAANENDTRMYRQQIGEMGDEQDLAGMMVRALQAGDDFSRNAPKIASSIAATPGSGYSPAAADRLAVGTGTQTAGGTFTGLADTLANALTQTGMNASSRERIATADRDAEIGLAREGHQAFATALRGVNPAAQGALERLQGVVGPLKINSAYRDPEHNAKVGGAKNSQHTHGNAFDVDVSGMSLQGREELIRKAREAGFKGIGVYDNSLHFDIGPERAWGPSYGRDSLPEWAQDDVLAPTGGGEQESIIDPRALELLIAGGAPGVTGNQSRILGGIADLMMPDDPFGADVDDADVPTLSAGGRTALLKALGDDTPPEVAMRIVADVDQLLAQGMSENEALAYALQPSNQRRGADVVDDGWLWDSIEPGAIEGLNLPGQAPVGDDVAAALQEARDAIKAGAPAEAVIAELRRMGYDPAGL